MMRKVCVSAIAIFLDDSFLQVCIHDSCLWHACMRWGCGAVDGKVEPQLPGVGVVAQVYAATAMLTIALVAQAYVQPFTSNLHNNLEMLSLIASQITQVRAPFPTAKLLLCTGRQHDLWTWCAPQMGSILNWRYPGQSTLITITLIGVNTITCAIFVGAIMYSARKKVTASSFHSRVTSRVRAALVGSTSFFLFFVFLVFLGVP